MTDKQAKDDQRHKKKMEKQKENIDATIASAVKDEESLFYLLAMARVRPAQHLGWYCERWDMDLGLA